MVHERKVQSIENNNNVAAHPYYIHGDAMVEYPVVEIIFIIKRSNYINNCFKTLGLVLNKVHVLEVMPNRDADPSKTVHIEKHKEVIKRPSCCTFDES